MAMDLGSKGSLKADINVTPLVDVVLVLLIIFMVAAPLATVNVQVDLPPANLEATPVEPMDLAVVVKTIEAMAPAGPANTHCAATTSMKRPATIAATMPETEAPTRTFPMMNARSRSG